MIKAVFLDAIKTIFKPYPSETGLFQKVILNITGIDLTEEELEPILARALAETENLNAVKNNSIQQWEYFPAKIAELVGCEKSECREIGEKFRYETWGNTENYRLYDDVLPALELLKARGLYIACVSNEDGWLSNFFDHFDISEYFEFVSTSGEIGVEKPNPEIFNEAISRTTFRPDEILFVGDSFLSDYVGSKNVGMLPLLIDREHKNTDNDVTTIENLTQILEYI